MKSLIPQHSLRIRLFIYLQLYDLHFGKKAGWGDGVCWERYPWGEVLRFGIPAEAVCRQFKMRSESWIVDSWIKDTAGAWKQDIQSVNGILNCVFSTQGYRSYLRTDSFRGQRYPEILQAWFLDPSGAWQLALQKVNGILFYYLVELRILLELENRCFES